MIERFLKIKKIYRYIGGVILLGVVCLVLILLFLKGPGTDTAPDDEITPGTNPVADAVTITGTDTVTDAAIVPTDPATDASTAPGTDPATDAVAVTETVTTSDAANVTETVPATGAATAMGTDPAASAVTVTEVIQAAQTVTETGTDPIVDTVTVPAGQTTFSIDLDIGVGEPYAGIEVALSLSDESALEFTSFTPGFSNAIASPFMSKDGLHYFGFYNMTGSNIFPVDETMIGTLDFTGYTGDQTLTVTVIQMNVIRIDENNQSITTIKESPYRIITVQRETGE
ncbi:MAG: hypothetical protein FWH55_13315 [Oscillospiraceae bacterium]|nr:hypothetical protein [Oscillospiraceae bacterium]